MTQEELEIICNEFITSYGQILANNVVQNLSSTNKGFENLEENFMGIENKARNVFIAIGDKWTKSAELRNFWNNDFIDYINSYISYVPKSMTLH